MVKDFILHRTVTTHAIRPLAVGARVCNPRKLDNRKQQESNDYLRTKNQVLKASEIFVDLIPVLEEMEFPPFHYWELGGELEDSAKAQKNLAKWMLPCFGGIIFLLVWQFNSRAPGPGRIHREQRHCHDR